MASAQNNAWRKAYVLATLLLAASMVPALNWEQLDSNGNLLVLAALSAALLVGGIAVLYRRLVFRLGAFYGFAFVVLQTYATPVFVEDRIVLRDLRTLIPNYSASVVIDSQWLHGISGLQSISTDALGFRTTKPIDYANKPSSAIRIFTVGGSTTEQIHLSNNKTWSARLEADLERQLSRPVEIINTGVSGLRVGHHAATARYTKRFETDFFIILLGLNDWNIHFTDDNLKLVDEREEDTVLTPVRKFFEPFPKFHDSVFHRWLTTLRQGTEDFADRQRYNPSHPPPSKDGLIELDPGAYYENQIHYPERGEIRRMQVDRVSRQFAQHFRRLLRECEAVPCLIVNQPSAYKPGITDELKRKLWMTPANKEWTIDFEDIVRAARTYNRYIISTAQEAGQIACDIADELPPNERYFYDDAHFTQFGSDVIAGLISRCFLGLFAVKLT